MTTYYKIRNKHDPTQFHKGGIYDQWSKTGKVWTTLGALRSFLTTTLQNERRTRQISNWEIIELDIPEGKVRDLHELIKPEQLIKMLTK